MMTKEELIASDDSVLLDLIDRAKGNTGKDFSSAMDCDFSYTFVTTELQRRGYKNGWYKEQQSKKQEDEVMVIDATQNTKTVRKAFSVSEDVAEKWAEFTKGVPGRTALMDKALSDFMDKAQKGKVKVEFELGKQQVEAEEAEAAE